MELNLRGSRFRMQADIYQFLIMQHG